jgi:uncharacterized protein YfaS (alpha-2-macroglobulin family)
MKIIGGAFSSTGGRRWTAALAVVLSYAGFTGLMTWKTAVPLLESLADNWGWILLLLSVAVSAVRAWFLKERARPFAVAATIFILSALTFDNRFIASGSEPTLFYRILFLHIAALLGLIAVPPASGLLSRWVNRPRGGFLGRPLGVWSAWIVLAILFMAALRRGAVEDVEKWLAASPFTLALTALGTGIYWRKRLKKPVEIWFGAALLFASGAFLSVHGGFFESLVDGLVSLSRFAFAAKRVPGWPPDMLSSLAYLFPLYAAAGIYVFHEELKAALWTEHFRGIIRRDIESLKALRARFKEWLTRHKSAEVSPALSSSGRVKAFLRRPAARKSMVSLAGLAVLAGLAWGGRILYRHWTVGIMEFSPTGEVSDRTVIRITFSDPVRAEGYLHQVDCFHVDPSIGGTYRQEAPQTIVFVPREPLKPSTRYAVRFDPKNLRCKGKRFPSGVSTEFHTPFFGVQDVKLMYQFDLLNDQEMDVIGDVSFNQPLRYEDLKANLSLSKDGKPVAFTLEKSNRPDKFYFKIAALKRELKEQKIVLEIKKGLNCLDGGAPLESDYRRELVLPSKPKLEVAEVKPWCQAGETMVSVLFNMPVSEDQIRRSVVVEPSVGFSVETEYAYAVLRGDFKPNVSYKVTVRKGLIAKSGQALENDYVGGVTIRDLPPKVEFSYPGRVLSLTGPKVLELKAMNLDRVNYTIQKVFRNNLTLFLNNQDYPPMAKFIASGSFAVQGGEINREVPQYVNLSALNDQPYKGLFAIELRDPRQSYNRTYSWFLCTDLGLIAKQSGDDLIVYAQSVETLRPIAGASLEMISNDNQVMDKQTTDASGRVVFQHWKKHEYGLHPYYLTAKKEDDFSFLTFDRMELNAYQFPIGGAPSGDRRMEAFLSTERGVYRPGESAYLTAVVRNGDGSVPADVPLKLVVRDPRGAEFFSADGRMNANGLLTFEVPFSIAALTGQYEASLMRAGRPETLGTVSLKVEEFIPDKLKVDIDAPKTPVAPGAKLVFAVQARQLFGPPAAGNKATTWVRFTARDFDPKGFEDYAFHDPLRTFEEDTVELGDGKLDDKGRLSFEVDVPKVQVPSALKAYMYSEVTDSGGRPVSAAGTADINVYSRCLGLKLEENLPIRAKQTVHFRAVALSAEGKPVDAAGVRLVVKRKSWYSIFRRGSWGRSGYQSTSYEELVVDKKIDVKNGKASFEFTPEGEGDYTVVLVDPDGMRTGVTVQAMGLGMEASAMESPEQLQLVLDKKSYRPGEEANVLVRSPFAGKLYLTVEREKVFETRVIEMTGRETSVSLPVEASYLPNVYIVGLASRRPNDKDRSLPMVSFGVATLEVKKDSKRIGLAWDAPEEVQSKDGIEVSVAVEGEAGKTDVILAAVDEGVLQITNFPTPDPLEFFYRRRALETHSFTMLDLLLPDIAEAKKFALGGGDEGEVARRHLNPVAAKKHLSYARFSGILKPGADGRVRYKFDTKNFIGEARIMAMAVRGDKYGSSARPVRVADPIVVFANFPRFAGPRDQFHVPVEVFNKTGKPCVVTVTMEAKGPVKVQEKTQTTKSLAPESSKRVLFLVEAAPDAGVAKFHVTASGNGYESVRDEELSVRPYTHLVTTVEQGTLNPGGADNIRVPSGYIPFGQRMRLSVSTNPLIRYLRSLDYLIAYPYGCTEQVSSQVFPLIYMKELGYATGRFSDKANAVDLFVQDGIHRLEKRQLGTGEFSLWPGGGSAGSYVTLYASHVLLEAKAQGYDVSPLVYGRIVSYLSRAGSAPSVEYNQEGERRGEGTVSEGGGEEGGGEGNVSEGEGGGEGTVPLGEGGGEGTVSEGGEEGGGNAPDSVQDATQGRLDRRGQNVNAGQIDAYKVYLKALAGQPDREAMSVLFNQRLKTLGETDRAWLSLSYSKIGDAETAQKVLDPSFKSKFFHREQFGDYNSSVRNTALYLYALASANPQAPKVNEVVEYLGRQVKDGHFGNTQEDAWVFMALAKVFGARGEAVKTEVLADDKPYKVLEGRESNALDNALSGKKLTLKNAGEKKSYYYFMAEGTPLEKGTKTYSKGLTIERTIRTAEGKEANLTSVAQGDLLVVTLSVSPEKEPVHNVVVVDLLPGGFEVENPRLTSRGQLGFEPLQGFNPAYMDIRDDRVLLFADEVSGTQNFSYTVRAVTPGRFTIPNAYAEAMYDPDIRAESATKDTLVVADDNGGK